MFKNKDVNMLKGSMFKSIVIYTVPIIFSNILQLLFNAADIIVAGRFCGSVSVAAVGSTGSLVNLLVNIMSGLSIGTGIITAQSIGSGDRHTVKIAVHTAVPTAVIIGFITLILGFFLSGDMLRWMDTPEDVLPLSETYLKIYFLGAVSLSVYNFGSSILRAAGDTKSPFIFLSIAGVMNVILNVIFVTVFDMNVAGVAWATIISQTFSAIMVIIVLMRRTDACKLILKEFRLHKTVLMKILRIGIPAGIQGATYSISNVIIQSSVNAFGSAVVSGNAAASNIEGFVFTSMNAFHQTALNFTGQNVGAGNYKRTKNALYICLACVTVIGAVLGVGAYILGNPLLSIYITDSKAAINAGMIRLAHVCAIYFLCGIQDVVNGAVRGLGASISSMLVSVMGACVFRVGWIYTIFRIPEYHTINSLYYSYPISWVLLFVALMINYYIVLSRKKKLYKLTDEGDRYEE